MGSVENKRVVGLEEPEKKTQDEKRLEKNVNNIFQLPVSKITQVHLGKAIRAASSTKMESVEKLVWKKISAVHVVDLASSNNHNLHVKVLQSSPKYLHDNINYAVLTINWPSGFFFYKMAIIHFMKKIWDNLK